MPIYGYRCEQCGHELEVMQSISEAPLRVCPNCMGPLRKLIYPAGIIFKGSGYYTTDYKGAGKSTTDGEGSSSTSEAVSKTETKTEVKAESKPAGEKPAKAAKPASE